MKLQIEKVTSVKAQEQEQAYSTQEKLAPDRRYTVRNGKRVWIDGVQSAGGGTGSPGKTRAPVLSSSLLYRVSGTQ